MLKESFEKWKEKGNAMLWMLDEIGINSVGQKDAIIIRAQGKDIFPLKGGLGKTMFDNEHKIDIVMPADWIPGPRQGDWTYDMYAALPADGHHYEIVQGVLMVSPAPDTAHQGVIEEINAYLRERIFLTDRGLVLTSPVDVVFSSQKTVQPDILLLLAEHIDRLQERYIAGPPDLAVEVISPGSVTFDRLVKYSLYEQEGVPEYWLVNRPEQTVEVFVLETGKYYLLGAFRGEQALQSRIVPGPAVPVSQFFKWTGRLR